MIKLDDLNLFTRVVQKGALATAGRELGLSPASVSSKINALESYYQAKLLNRTTRKISLTEVGEKIYEVANNILSQMHDLDDEVLNSQSNVSGSIRITAPSSVGRGYISDAILEFKKIHPDISIHLHLSDDLVDLSNGTHDIAIRYGDLPDSTLVGRKLITNKRVLVASNTYLQKYGVPNTPEDLKKHQCLTIIRGGEPLNYWHLIRDNQVSSVHLKESLSSNDGDILMNWALLGYGLSMKSLIEVAEHIQNQKLEIVLPDYFIDFVKPHKNLDPINQIYSNSDLHLVYPSREYMPKKNSIFIKFLTKSFKELEDKLKLNEANNRNK